MEIIRECWGDEHQFLLLTQDCFLTQHVLEPTRGGNVLDLILSSQNELVDIKYVKVHEPSGSSDHNHIHFTIKVKTGNTYKKQWTRNFNKGKYKEMRTYLLNRDWNYWEICSIKKTRERSRRKHLSKEAFRKNCSQADAVGVLGGGI